MRNNLIYLYVILQYYFNTSCNPRKMRLNQRWIQDLNVEVEHLLDRGGSDLHNFVSEANTPNYMYFFAIYFKQVFGRREGMRACCPSTHLLNPCLWMIIAHLQNAPSRIQGDAALFKYFLKFGIDNVQWKLKLKAEGLAVREPLSDWPIQATS